MNSLNLHFSKPNQLDLCFIKGIAFDGSYYILLDKKNCKIIKLDETMCIVDTVAMQQKFTSICYDCLCDCYWAVVNNSAAVIYQLDQCFNIVDKINVRNAGQRCVKSISYDAANQVLWICFPNCIGYLAKESNELCYRKNPSNQIYNNAILSFDDGRLIAYEENCLPFIDILFDECCDSVSVCVPKGFILEDMCLTKVAISEMDNCRVYNICLLLTQKGTKCNYILHCNLHHCVLVECPVVCDITIEDCSGENCHPCPPPHPCHKCCCRQKICSAKWKIMHSIALEEAGIAHILNAEGEKIQKAVAHSKNIKELLCVNESVKQTIIQITQLETELYLKLDTLMKNCNCDDCVCCHDDDHSCNNNDCIGNTDTDTKFICEECDLDQEY